MKKIISMISAVLVTFALSSPITSIAKSAEFFKNASNYKSIDDEMIKKYAPNVVEGVSKLSNWAKNL